MSDTGNTIDAGDIWVTGAPSAPPRREDETGAPVPLPPPSASDTELAAAALAVLGEVTPLLPAVARSGGFASPAVTLTRMMDTLLRAVQERDAENETLRSALRPFATMTHFTILDGGQILHDCTTCDWSTLADDEAEKPKHDEGCPFGEARELLGMGEETTQ